MPALRPVALIALALLAVPAPAQSASLYKCSDANAVISIQSSPCATGSTQVWKRDANPEPARTADQLTAAAVQRQRNADDARELSLAAGTTRPTPQAAPMPAPVAAPVAAVDPTLKGPCRRAHELARDIRALDLLEMRSDQLQRLDAWVVKQCEQARTGE